MDSFSPTYKPTMDVDFTQSNVMVGEQRLRVALWQASRGSFAYGGGVVAGVPPSAFRAEATTAFHFPPCRACFFPHLHEQVKFRFSCIGFLRLLLIVC